MHLLIVFSVIATLLSPPNRNKQDNTPEPKHASSYQAQAKTPETTPINNAGTSKEYSQPYYQPHPWPPPWWDPFWSNWSLVIVGIAAATFALHSWTATRAAATAAQSSANALINVERPWVLIFKAERSEEHFVSSDDPQAGRERHISVKWTFKNFGKTPAFIKGVSGGVGVTKTIERFTKNYDWPRSFAPDPILAPGQVSEEMKFISDSVLQEDDWRRMLKGEQFLVFYGLIKYDDPFGRHHLSKFSYVYDFMIRTPGFKVRWTEPGHPEFEETKYT